MAKVFSPRIRLMRLNEEICPLDMGAWTGNKALREGEAENRLWNRVTCDQQVSEWKFYGSFKGMFDNNQKEIKIIDQRKKEVLSRITIQLKRKGKQQKDLIAYLHLPVGTYTNWNRGKGNAYMLYLLEISEYLDVSVYYLLTGSDPYKELLNGKIRDDEVILLKKYNSLNGNDRMKVLKLMDAMH